MRTDELIHQLERLSSLAKVAAEQVRLGNLRDIKISNATADIHRPNFGHLVLGPFRVHVEAPAPIDIEAVLVDTRTEPKHSS